jgi:GTPase SAR1 family protein
LVYDIARKDSFEELREYWSKQIKENAPKKIGKI